MSYSKDKSHSPTGERETGKPHPDCELNYGKWRGLIKDNKSFVKNLLENNIGVKEYFKYNGKEYINEILKPSWTDGIHKHSASFDGRDFQDAFPGAIPIYIQLRVDRQNVATINFHQNTRDFKNDAKYLLKADLNVDNDWG